jgi:hypothetical protein
MGLTTFQFAVPAACATIVPGNVMAIASNACEIREIFIENSLRRFSAVARTNQKTSNNRFGSGSPKPAPLIDCQ